MALPRSNLYEDNLIGYNVRFLAYLNDVELPQIAIKAFKIKTNIIDFIPTIEIIIDLPEDKDTLSIKYNDVITLVFNYTTTANTIKFNILDFEEHRLTGTKYSYVCIGYLHCDTNMFNNYNASYNNKTSVEVIKAVCASLGIKTNNVTLNSLDLMTWVQSTNNYNFILDTLSRSYIGDNETIVGNINLQGELRLNTINDTRTNYSKNDMTTLEYNAQAVAQLDSVLFNNDTSKKVIPFSNMKTNTFNSYQEYITSVNFVNYDVEKSAPISYTTENYGSGSSTVFNLINDVHSKYTYARVNNKINIQKLVYNESWYLTLVNCMNFNLMDNVFVKTYKPMLNGKEQLEQSKSGVATIIGIDYSYSDSAKYVNTELILSKV